MPYVYSTATSANEYAEWVKNGDQQTIQRIVRVEGGHGVMNKNFLTPLGVATEVSEDDLQFLLNHDQFKIHMKNGFMSVDKKKVETEKAVANMKLKDGSAPVTPADYAKGGRFEGVAEPKVTGTN